MTSIKTVPTATTLVKPFLPTTRLVTSDAEKVATKERREHKRGNAGRVSAD